MKNEIIIYQPDTADVQLEVRIEDETVWLTQAQMVDLFQTTKQNVSLHISNIFKERELDANSTVKEILTVRYEGARQIRRNVKLYNLDVIISVGYRVKSQRGTQFRIWANKILKNYLLRGYAANERFERLEYRVHQTEEMLAEQQKSIDFILKTEIRPTQGVFFQGQIFDAYALFEKIIGEAENEIILIDNYVDLSVLERFAKKKSGIKITIFTNPKTAISPLDIEKFNAQYAGLELKFTEKVHDRFLIIDEKEIYHLGASLKDLGKKCFAFSVMERDWIGKILEEVLAY